MNKQYNHSITELQTPNRLYHGTPERRLEKLLDEGVSVKEAAKSQNGRKIQCITPSLEEAIYFTHHVHLMFGGGNRYLGVVQIDPSKLRKRTREQFEPDQLNPKSLVTYHSIPSTSFDKLFLVDINGTRTDMLDKSNELSEKYGIDVVTIDYDLANNSFRFKERSLP
jgi:hypothetical protein